MVSLIVFWNCQCDSTIHEYYTISIWIKVQQRIALCEINLKWHNCNFIARFEWSPVVILNWLFENEQNERSSQQQAGRQTTTDNASLLSSAKQLKLQYIYCTSGTLSKYKVGMLNNWPWCILCFRAQCCCTVLGRTNLILL